MVNYNFTGNPFVDTGLSVLVARARDSGWSGDSLQELTPHELQHAIGDGTWLAQANRRLKAFSMVVGNNSIFNDLFEDTRGGPTVQLAALQEIIADYADRLMTPVFIGIRTGYLHADSESALRAWVKAQETSMARGEDVHKVVLTTPMQAIYQFVKVLP